MAAAGYAPLEDIEEHASDGIPLMSRNPFAQTTTPRQPSRAQTFPRLQSASYPASEPLQQGSAANQVQPTSYEDYKSDGKSERRRSSVQSWKQRIKGFVNPSMHDLHDSYLIAPNTVRPYDHKRQRWRLWRLTIGEFFITVALSLAYFLLLYGWAQHKTIDERQKRVFNALSTGLSLLLGLNLAGSLRSYAKLLRWRMLAAAYRPLETFDLVLGCDSQINVLRLLWKARNSRFRYLPSRTQIFCLLWLLVNLVMAGVVASIGLTYNLNTSNNFVLTASGEVSVLDFSALLSDNYDFDLSRLQSWGITGGSWNQINSFEYEDAAQGWYETDFSGYARYWFIDVNPKNSAQDISWRSVDAGVTCMSYQVTDGIYGNKSYIIYNDGSRDVNLTLLAEPSPGGLAFVSSTNSTCGQRCTHVQAFQAISLPGDEFTNIVKPVFFDCQSILYNVADVSGQQVPSYGRISDQLARMFAGSVGWSGNPLPTSNSPLQYMTYGEASVVGFTTDPSESDMQDLIADFTIGAIAALDDPKIGYERTTGEGTAPSQAEYLDIHWWQAGPLLIVIPCVHFTTLVIVIWWANRAIIKDDSHLAAAKLYHSLLTSKNLADHGCMLKGGEMVEAMKNPMVAYGWSETGGIHHTDVFENESGMDPDVKFQEGSYDGTGWEPYSGAEDASSRTVNARSYF